MLRVAYIAAGAGDLYCGACAADLALVRALRRRGAVTVMVPLYTPLRGGEDLIAGHKVFLGGISTWLRTASPPFSWLARSLRPLLDSRLLLSAASRLAVRTDPHALGPLTVSVLRGEAGPHRAELQRIFAYLRAEVRPHVVHLSNSLLSALAGPLKRELGCPVVCSVQGEEHFLTALPSPHREIAMRLLRENLRSVDAIVRPTASNAAMVGELTGREAATFALVPPALEISPLPPPLRNTRHIVIGYLSALRPEKGLDLLISALADIAPRLGSPVEFRIAGQIADAKWWNRQQHRLEGLLPGVCPRYLGELAPAQKALLLAECHIFVMPSRIAEPRAMAALEAMAGGCAVVAPRHGIFEELLAESPQLLFPPGDLRTLSDILYRLLRNYAEIAEAGAKAAITARRYAADASASRLLDVYTRCCGPAAG